jgi:hypothetical protein
MSRVPVAALVAGFGFLLAPVAASADDFAGTALNIIPSGQYGSVPIPPGADEQAKMYDSLTPLFDNVTAADLLTAFKSERFGVDTSGPGRPEAVPRSGVTIVRDRFNVPHITGKTRDDVTWAMGWTLRRTAPMTTRVSSRSQTSDQGPFPPFVQSKYVHPRGRSRMKSKSRITARALRHVISDLPVVT